MGVWLVSKEEGETPCHLHRVVVVCRRRRVMAIP
jgi:hypothetical protein